MEDKIEIDGNEHIAPLGLGNLKKGMIGPVLMAQLLKHQYSGPGNPGGITREIISLDNRDKNSHTKKEAVFTSGKLKGFHHKHYFSAHHIAYNMMQYRLDHTTGELGESFTRVFNRTLKADKTDDEKAMAIANFLTMDSYRQRSKSRSLSGDWIIYKKHDGKNYYLCLSTHEERTDTLYDYLQKWYGQFLARIISKLKFNRIKQHQSLCSFGSLTVSGVEAINQLSARSCQTSPFGSQP